MQPNHASILSELLMCSTALGAGVLPPFDNLYDHGGMIFAAAASDEFKIRVRKAASTFRADGQETQRRLERRIEQLEGDVAADVDGAVEELESLRPELDQTRHPFCNDFAATRDMILEMASKSRHGHMALIDEYGFRLSAALRLSAKFGNEIGFLSMTAIGLDQALIRGFGQGTLFEKHLLSGPTAAFTYFSAPPVELAKKLADKLSTSTHMSPMKGHAVIIAQPKLRTASLGVSQQDILRLLNTYYVLGHLDESRRAKFKPESPQLIEMWKQFITGDDVLKILEVPDARMERADKLLNQWHVKPEVAAAYATRAALCCAVIDHTGDPLKIELRRSHYSLAVEFFKELYRDFLTRVHAGSKLADNAAAARAARASAIPSPARQEAAVENLMQAIKESPTRMISRKTAISLPAVSAALLDYIVENRSEFVELRGSDVEGMGTTKRAYGLRTEASNDLGESIDDLDEAVKAYAADPHDPMFDSMETVKHEIMRLAKALDSSPFGLPAVPITKMSSRQVRCLPAILKEYPDTFVMRGTPEAPEPPQLVKSPDDPDAPLDPGIPAVWVRRGVDGNSFRDWKLLTKLGFADVWST